MRRTLFFCLFALMGLSGWSQDLIITLTDSIECDVTRQDEQYIYFSYDNDYGTQSVLISKDEVREIQFNYYSEEATVSQVVNVFLDEPEDSSPYGVPIRKTVHLSASYVFSRRVSPAADGLPQNAAAFIDGLRNGRGYQGRLHFFINDEIGIGANVSTFEASNSSDSQIEILFFQNSSVTSTLRSDVSLFFIGPSFMGRHYLKDPDIQINYSFSAGYLRYREDLQRENELAQSEGSTFGLNGDFGLEYLFVPSVAIGAGVGFGLGTITDLDVTINGNTQREELEQNEGFTRLNFFLGLRFHL